MSENHETGRVATAIPAFKKAAKRLQRATGRPHHECLEITAREHGYQSWKAALLANADTGLNDAQVGALWVIVDVKEAEDFDPNVWSLDRECLAIHLSTIVGWYRADDHSASDAELIEHVRLNLVCLRYVGKEHLPLRHTLEAWLDERVAWWPMGLVSDGDVAYLEDGGVHIAR